MFEALKRLIHAWRHDDPMENICSAAISKKHIALRDCTLRSIKIPISGVLTEIDDLDKFDIDSCGCVHWPDHNVRISLHAAKKPELKGIRLSIYARIAQGKHAVYSKVADRGTAEHLEFLF
jgi:hypothetical protein